MLYFNELSNRVIRDRVDLIAVYEEYRATAHAAQSELAGTMEYETRAGRDYLYRRISRSGLRSSKSLGPRSAATDLILARFRDQKTAAEARLARLAARMDELAAVMRALRHQRVPTLAARIIRKLADSPAAARFRVVGTHALYAYEAAAAVEFQSDMVATGDLDVLVDDRAPLRIAVEGNLRGLEALAKTVDPSFAQRRRGDYRLTNKDGFMLEFIRPQARPAHRVKPGQETGVEGDAMPVPIIGLEWLVSAPAFSAIAIDDRGYPVPMTVPAPAIWAAHKLWVAAQMDRDPGKAQRDRQQAAAVLALIEARLPQERLDPAKHSALPKAIADLAAELAPKPARRLTPDW